MEERQTRPDEATHGEELVEARQEHVAGRAASGEEEAAAEQYRSEHRKDGDDVAGHYEEMTEIGAEAKGEGRIE